MTQNPVQFPLTFPFTFGFYSYTIQGKSTIYVRNPIEIIRRILVENWNTKNAPQPTINSILEYKRVDYHNDYVLISVINDIENPIDYRYAYTNKSVELSIDIGTSSSYFRLRQLQREVMRILHSKRREPMDDYHKLLILRTTDLSDESVKFYRVVIDCELRKVMEVVSTAPP